MFFAKFAVPLSALSVAVLAAPTDAPAKIPRKVGKRCTGTINSAASVAAAVECTTIVIGTLWL